MGEDMDKHVARICIGDSEESARIIELLARGSFQVSFVTEKFIDLALACIMFDRKFGILNVNQAK